MSSRAEDIEEGGSIRMTVREGRNMKEEVVYLLKQAGRKGEFIKAKTTKLHAKTIKSS